MSTLTDVFKKVCLLWCATICVVTAAGFVHAQNEASVEVTAIMAAHESEFIDPDLTSIASEIKTLFSYSSYTKINTYTVLLGEKQSDRITLPRNQDLVVTFTGADESGKLDLNIDMGEALNTDVSIMPGSHILIGGPEYDDGTLIFLIETTQ